MLFYTSLQGQEKAAEDSPSAASLFSCRRSSGGRLGLRRKRRACLRDDAAERRALVHGDVGQDLAVQVDAGELQPVHELAVGQALGPNRGVDALDPQRPERALLHLAVAIGVLTGLLDGLLGDADRVLATAVIALRLLQDPLVAGLGGGPALDACHGGSSLLQAVGRPGLHPRRIGVGEHLGTAILADIFGIVADQPVALASDSVLELAGSGELEALLHAALRLQLGHFRLLARMCATFWNSHGSPVGRAVRFFRSWKEAAPIEARGR